MNYKSICDKCPEKAILIIAYANVSLCVNHAPRMANGDPGYKELTIYGKDKRGHDALTQPLEEFLEEFSKPFPFQECRCCGEKNKRRLLHQKIIHDPRIDFPFVAVDVIGCEYWICKNGDACHKRQIDNNNYVNNS